MGTNLTLYKVEFAFLSNPVCRVHGKKEHSPKRYVLIPLSAIKFVSQDYYMIGSRENQAENYNSESGKGDPVWPAGN